MLDLTASEWTIGQEQQLSNTLYVLRTTSDQNLLYLYIIWLAKKVTSDPLTQELLAITRQKNRSAIA